MKIGVLFTCYNCEDYVDQCLEPWLKLRDEMNFVFAASSGMFKDYLALGITEKNEGTLRKLITKKLDFLVTTSGKNLLDEEASRNTCLNFLKKQQCDLIILLDGDEVYTEDQIRKIFAFVQEHPTYDAYAINFKNFYFREGIFTYDFCHHRIFWLNRHGGIREFHFDNELHYEDGSDPYAYRRDIPREIAFVDHYSWLSNDPRTRDKILYQNNRYTGHDGTFPKHLRCSFAWNDERQRLEFNQDFWAWKAGETPTLHEMVQGSPYSFDFKMGFDKTGNKILIERVKISGTIVVKIFDGQNDSLLYTSTIEVLPDFSYWINPNVNLNYDQVEDFKKFRVQVFMKEQLVHEENLHIKIY